MKEKVIGILGGMGPEATLELYGKIIARTPAGKDQEHLRVIIDSNPKIPDRTAAILEGGESPVPAMAESAGALHRAGAHFIVIPCVSAHFFLADLRALSPLPILSIFDATALEIRRRCPGLRTAGLLGTTGTIRGGRFQARLKESGVETLVPDAPGQERVMGAIYGVKDSQSGRSRSELTAAVRTVAEGLLARGAQGIVTGCTELPLVLRDGDLSAPVFDTLLALALAAIRETGREPIPISQGGNP
jgi:aspartate racemase